jgi:hypothetical protein
MALLNTRKLLPNDQWLLNHCALKCHFLEPVSTEGLTEADVEPLKEKVFKIMEAYVLEHDALFQTKRH